MGRCGWRAILAALTLGLVAVLPQQAFAQATVTIVATFTWDGSHDCVNPRTNSVICISGKADVRGLGHVEYARDAVTTGEQTPDGCPKLSTIGTIWVTGGTAILKGKPANTCGAKDNPDAHYLYTISGGTGVLAGASGSGDIVADHGVDRWHGTLSGPHLPLASATAAAPTPSAPPTSAAPVATSAAATSATATHVAATTAAAASSSPPAPTSAAPVTSSPSTPLAAAAGTSSSFSLAAWVAVPAVVVLGGGLTVVLVRRRRAGSGQRPA